MEDQEGTPSISDPLTGAYSRALLGPRLGEELSRASRSSTGCALFLFDVDYFKSINAAYGHGRGDEVLIALTERINGLGRGYAVLFRYGGDEFVLLLPDTVAADAVRVALRMVEGIRDTPFGGLDTFNRMLAARESGAHHEGRAERGLVTAEDQTGVRRYTS